MSNPQLENAALTAARSEPRIGPGFHADRLEIDDRGALTVEAEVDSVAQKRLALERMAALPGVAGIIDRIRVRPAIPMADGGIMDELRRRFAEDASFENLAVKEARLGRLEPVRDAVGKPAGTIELEVADGVVTLNGSAPSLASKRLAGVLAWWVPGVRDVVNGMAVDPPEEDAPILIEEAVKLALEQDPFLNASQIRVGVRHAVVRLTGLVKSERAREAAEADAWAVFGVDDVINEIEVGA